MTNQKEILVGVVTHFFGKIMVAVVDLSKGLKMGDEIRIVGGERDFIQIADSMEIDHQKLEVAKAGQDIGLRLKEKACPGDKIFKI